MMGAFDFVDGSRAYTCRVEEADGGPPEARWWFGVAGDDSRYALSELMPATRRHRCAPAWY
jgi:hypothetical protein